MLGTEHEDEQRRLLIAADIHDDSVQAMIAADMKLEHLKQKAGPEAEPLVSETQEIVRSAAQRLRRLLFELAPVEPGISLAQALERYLQASMDGFSFAVVDRLSSQPPPATVGVAYRLAQETIRNAKRHSCATEISVELRDVDGGLLVEIADNGRGFAIRSSSPGHLGLAAMRIRAEQAGGWLALDSQPGKGTTVTFWLEMPDSPPQPLRAINRYGKPIFTPVAGRVKQRSARPVSRWSKGARRWS